MNKNGTCFVIMGYGMKTDYSTGRVLNLDKTYKNIIKPTVEELGFQCIRADELRHSGMIDTHMYNYLINADIVIADLSTYNPNAFYELGVRHALRPYTTIVIAEKELQEPFDVNHTVIRKYEHLAAGIDHDEVMRFREELKLVINEIRTAPQTDSPVYTFLEGLQQPKFSYADVQIEKKNKEQETLSKIVELALEKLDSNDFSHACELFKMALQIDENNIFLLQNLILSTYKSKKPTTLDALNAALQLLIALHPETTTDPETLGLAGAIYKRLWEETGEIEHLGKSIYFYEKGFYIKNDYYNGINYAYLLNLRGSIKEGHEAITDYVLANRVRKKVVDICRVILEDSNFGERDDQYWVMATLEEAYFGLGEGKLYDDYKELSKKISKENWERETTDAQIGKLKQLLSKQI